MSSISAKRSLIDTSFASQESKSKFNDDEMKNENGEILEDSKSATWKIGQTVPYAALVSLFEAVKAEPKRLKILSLVSNFLRSVILVSPDQLLATIYLCCNKIAPAYEGKEIGVGDTTLLKAVSEATGASEQKLKLALKETGDLGEVANANRTTQKTMFATAKLTVNGVFKTLRELADMNGKNTNNKKKDVIKQLLVSCCGNEARYIVRALQGNLRIGLAEKGVIAALAHAVTMTFDSRRECGANNTFETNLAVPLGACYGKGKRTGIFGSFLLGVYDDESEEYQTICNIGTGFSDEDLATHATFFNQHLLPAKPNYYNVWDSIKVDVWFDACQVWEVKCADLSISPVHTAAMGKVNESKGIALRFPRFVKIREDKQKDDATNAEQVVHMYRNQVVIASEKK